MMAADLRRDLTSKILPSLRHELSRYLVVSLYLFVCLGAIALHKEAVLGQIGIHVVPYGYAIINALILGKFILLGDAIHIGDRSRNKPLLLHVIHKVIALGLLLIVLSIIEEAAVGLFHGQSLVSAFARFAHESRLQVLTHALLGFLFLVPLVTFSELGQRIGWEHVRRIFLGEKRSMRSLH